MASLSAIPADKRYLFVMPVDNYRSDFYIQENIIGYTGDRDRDPTVYFLDAPFQGVGKWHYNVEYGRITQCYSDTKNIGRERVCMGGMYGIQILNGVPHEYAGPGLEMHKVGDIHHSRNAFVQVKDDQTRAILSHAISRFTRLKDFRCYCPRDPGRP